MRLHEHAENTVLNIRITVKQSKLCSPVFVCEYLAGNSCLITSRVVCFMLSYFVPRIAVFGLVCLGNKHVKMNDQIRHAQ